MPLNEIARRYADNHFNLALEQTVQKVQQGIKTLRSKNAARGSVLSGNQLIAEAEILLESIRTMANAKKEGLLQA